MTTSVIGAVNVNRLMLATACLASWLADGVAPFLSGNGAGAAALVAADVACEVLALIGRWPTGAIWAAGTWAAT